MESRDWIRASELQAYHYCARSWWLRYVLGLEPEDQTLLVAGTGHHRNQGRQVLRGVWLGRVALLVLVMALALAGLALAGLLGGI